MITLAYILPRWYKLSMIRRKANNNDFLDIFGLSGPSKKVLLDIIEHGISTVADISARTGLPKSTIYDSIPPLLDQSLINQYLDDRGKSFGVSDQTQIIRANEKKLEDLKGAQNSFLSLIKDNLAKDTVARPRIKFYAGTLGIKQAFRDMPWQKDIKEAYMLWPNREMLDIDEDFFRWHGSSRFKHEVFIYAIENHRDRKMQKMKKHEWIWSTKENLAEARYLPKGVDCKMSFWLYGNKCLFASGGQEKIAFVVHSKEFCLMMKILWQSLWETSKK